MRAKLVLTALIFVAAVPAAFCWEYTFDVDHQWSYFDNDTGAATSVAPSSGVLSVDYPTFSVRYIFLDSDSRTPTFGSNKDLTGGHVSARLSYSGSVAPTFAYFFFAGSGESGDDQIYLTGEAGSWQGGTQTFWAASSDPLELGPEMAWTPTLYFSPETFTVLSVGTEHDSQRGSADSWGDSIATVDAVGIALGYMGTPPEGAKLNIDEFTVTPEPSILFLGAPLVGFLGWRIRRRGRRKTAKA